MAMPIDYKSLLSPSYDQIVGNGHSIGGPRLNASIVYS